MLFEGDAAVPTLVLLDLAIPNTSWFDVLARIRGCEATRRLPVVIISPSDRQPDLDKSFEFQANSFVQMGESQEIDATRLKLLLYYWIAVNKNVNA